MTQLILKYKTKQ